MEHTKFLQNIVMEMIKEVKYTRSGGIKQRTEDIDQFAVLDFLVYPFTESCLSCNYSAQLMSLIIYISFG